MLCNINLLAERKMEKKGGKEKESLITEIWLNIFWFIH